MRAGKGKARALLILLSGAMALVAVSAARPQNPNGAEQAGPYEALEIRDVTVIDGN